jgi:hypothetical protein
MDGVKEALGVTSATVLTDKTVADPRSGANLARERRTRLTVTIPHWASRAGLDCAIFSLVDNE